MDMKEIITTLISSDEIRDRMVLLASDRLKEYRVVLPIRKWRTWVTGLPRRKLRKHRIVSVTYKPGYYPMYGVFGYVLYKVYEPIKVTVLQEYDSEKRKWFDWMTDDPYHFYAMAELAYRSYGNVLVGGLGLGLIVHFLVNNPLVDRIYVIEKSIEVYELVKRSLPKRAGKIKVYIGDFFEIAPTMSNIDTVVADLWTGNLAENFPLLRKTRALVEKCFPKANHLYHGYQPYFDSEKILKDLNVLK